MIQIEIIKKATKNYELYMNIDGHTYGATQLIGIERTARQAMLKAVTIQDEISGLKINIDSETAKELGSWNANWNVTVKEHCKV